MRDVVFSRRSGWIPSVIREDGELKLMLAAGADANHEPRTFRVPMSEAHLAVIRDDLARHLLLWSAVLPLCDAAGTRGQLDEDEAVALLDPVLLSPPPDVDALFRRIRWDRTRLVAHGADIALLERGQVCAAMRTATELPNEKRAQEYHATRRRTERGISLGPLDAAILRYTGQFLHGATIPRRKPDAVDPALLPQIMRVIATAEQACAGMRIGLDPRRGHRATDKRDWKRMEAAVDAAVRRAYPELLDDAVRTVSFLMCSEAADRARSTPPEDDDSGVGATKTALSFSDDRGGEKTWVRGGPRGASAEFWEFVADRSGGDNDVFTIEDEEMGEGIQLHFYADSIARITTVGPKLVRCVSSYPRKCAATPRPGRSARRRGGTRRSRRRPGRPAPATSHPPRTPGDPRPAPGEPRPGLGDHEVGGRFDLQKSR
ncbi:DUF6357 family protein [Micromonospora sp. NPDC005710]|uniref:DUF6357 family protein n=1 Tax=Micromonospora sp. NPDC005710 TaxID=3157051 RepID=UPI0033CA9CC9